VPRCSRSLTASSSEQRLAARYNGGGVAARAALHWAPDDLYSNPQPSALEIQQQCSGWRHSHAVLSMSSRPMVHLWERAHRPSSRCTKEERNSEETRDLRGEWGRARSRRSLLDACRRPKKQSVFADTARPSKSILVLQQRMPYTGPSALLWCVLCAAGKHKQKRKEKKPLSIKNTSGLIKKMWLVFFRPPSPLCPRFFCTIFCVAFLNAPQQPPRGSSKR
jgi:hypothetical protein